jgi:hypothetical protein
MARCKIELLGRPLNLAHGRRSSNSCAWAPSGHPLRYQGYETENGRDGLESGILRILASHDERLVRIEGDVDVIKKRLELVVDAV